MSSQNVSDDKHQMTNRTPQRKVLGIDFGTRRIGTSLSDPLRIIAQAGATLKNDASLWKRLIELIEDNDVEMIVVGMPYTLKGEKGPKAKEVDSFIQTLKTKTRVSIVTWDERFTSTIAHQTMLRMGTKKAVRQDDKGRIDAMAAAIMLQSFLDSTKRSLCC